MVRPSTIVIALVMLFYAALARVQFTGTDDERNWHALLRSDVKGYHGYLRSLFILHDLGHEPYTKEYIHRTPDGTLNKCFAGESVMMAPFFLAAHTWAKVTGEKADGLGKPYMAGIAIAAWSYVLLGLLTFRALLRALGVRENSIAWVIGALGLGTQLALYTAHQPGWTHAYSFAAISAWSLAVRRAHRSGSWRTRMVVGALFGLIVLIRPVNALVLLALPVVIGDGWWTWLRAQLRPTVWLSYALPAFVVLLVQPLLWHAQTGHWIEWGYRGEGFYWDRPMALQLLFGIRRGLFIWTPVMIASAWCLVLLFRKDRTRAIAIAIYTVVLLYVAGCWWVWYYGSGFGPRVFIDHYSVLLLPLALMLDRLARLHRTMVLGFLALASSFHLAQFWQYRHGILHEVSMDRDMYAFTFLRFNERYRDQLGGNDQEAPFHPHGMSEVGSAQCDMESACTAWNNVRIVDHPHAPSGNHAAAVDSTNEWGPTVVFPAGTVPPDQRAHLVVDFDRYEAKARSSFGTLAVLSVETPGEGSTYYETVRMDRLPGSVDGEWRHVHYEIPIPDPVGAKQEVRFYLWNREHGHFLVDDMKAVLHTVNPY